MSFNEFETEFKDIHVLICKGIGKIHFGNKEHERGTNQVDYLITDTLTNTAWFVDEKDWKCRQVSVSLDVEKAKGMIELLKSYIEYKEGEE